MLHELLRYLPAMIFASADAGFRDPARRFEQKKKSSASMINIKLLGDASVRTWSVHHLHMAVWGISCSHPAIALTA